MGHHGGAQNAVLLISRNEFLKIWTSWFPIQKYREIMSNAGDWTKTRGLNPYFSGQSSSQTLFLEDGQMQTDVIFQSCEFANTWFYFILSLGGRGLFGCLHISSYKHYLNMRKTPREGVNYSGQTSIFFVIGKTLSSVFFLLSKKLFGNHNWDLSNESYILTPKR